ncbi:(2Fe-2S)-binding protein [Pseudomonas sp. Cab53]|uniref:aromatic ring-hydroxylating oxygenase subunit alpha n=1 Tax=Pseudomonas TaxID=286 RepID=UPI0019107A27|nr:MULTISPECIES: aromatic ring-hydroxylating dioxygenase subunit alpha [Pseudomonas]BBH32625.1 phenylpropionate dioxygenase [Pseudomonas sp. St290]BBP65776.1 (2Fe-2S)-binding protein [Pseudomonas sp. Cab53]GFM84559.1 (2Fe-2S)-binding protein [Pseudomonas cichorii]
MKPTKCKDQVILDLWHPLAALAEIPAGVVQKTVLLEENLSYAFDGKGIAAAWLTRPELSAGSSVEPGGLVGTLPVKIAYGYVWTSLGSAAELFPIPEFGEADRRNLNAATVGVNVSAPRAIENFLDMGHFPYVHTDILGAEPHTEVQEYDVEISTDRDEIVATCCRFFQPMASVASTGGADVDYVYRVPHPYCSVLYKSSPVDPSRLDVIAVFLQPIDQEHIRAHMMVCVLDEENEDKVIKRFQQTIFGQDKPILENQFPKRLPLDPRAETPIRADKSAIAYRRWLSQKGVTYGVIPAAT